MILSGQKVYDRWIRTRDALLEHGLFAKEDGDWALAEQVDKDLRMHYDLFKQDLRVAALMKYLDIDVSPKEEEVKGK